MTWIRRFIVWVTNLLFGKFQPDTTPLGGSSLGEAREAMRRAEADNLAVDRKAREVNQISAGFRRAAHADFNQLLEQSMHRSGRS